MSETAILLPAAVQAIMSILLLLLLGPARARSMREKRQSLDDRAVRLGQNAWSDRAQQISNCYKNQFELPVIFFAAVAFTLILRQPDPVMLALAWTFAVSRIAHAGVHVTVNIVWWRGLFFLVGAVALLTMWLRLVWRVVAGG
jgi:hypothetical protein